MKNKKAIVLLSGGQDSVTCLYWACKNFDEVQAIGFNYGQKHKIELELAKKNADILNIKYEVFDIRGIFQKSALVNHDEDTSGQHHRNKELPSTFTAGRNAVFLSVAAGYAFDNHADHIVTGVCQTDYSGYHDCRKRFVDAMQVAVSLAVDTDLTIHTPLMYLTKAETWKMAKDLGCLEAIINNTHTDYNGDHETFNEWGYGKLDNPASVLRANGYEEAKLKGWL